MKTSPNILVAGDGAVGCIVSGILKKKGFEITILAKSKERASRIETEGLNISGTCGNIQVKIPAIHNVTQIKKRPDYVFLATKAPDMPDIAKQLQPLLPDDCLVVSMQNGIVEEELSSIIGPHRTVGCVVGWGATKHSEGVPEMTSSGEFVIGYLNRKKDKRLEELASILSHIHPAETTDTILNHLYSKLIINACITTVGALCGLPLGRMLNKKIYRSLFLRIIEEAVNVADAMKLEIPMYAGKLDYYALLRWPSFRKHLFLRAFGLKYRKLKSSSLQSLEKGRKTEVHYFNGYISAKGREFGIETPVNNRLTGMVDEIERGERNISEENISEMMRSLKG